MADKTNDLLILCSSTVLVPYGEFPRKALHIKASQQKTLQTGGETSVLLLALWIRILIWWIRYLNDLMVKDPDLLLCYFGSLDPGPVPVPYYRYLSKIERM
jgi:hypothetical protein